MKRTSGLNLLLIDFVSSMLAWALFYYLRKIYVEHTSFQIEDSFYWGICLVPMGWVLFYALQGTYRDVRRLYRLKIFNLTFIATVFGSIVIFFTLLLNDEVSTYKSFYLSILILSMSHFFCVFIPRIIVVSFIVKAVHKNLIGFRTLLIGGSERAVTIYQEITALPKGEGNNFVGFVNLNGIDHLLKDSLPYLGHADDLEGIIREQGIEEVIIALDSSEHERLRNLLTRIEGSNVIVKILPDMYDIISGSVKMTNIFGALLIEVNAESMPVWQQSLKRAMDIVLSLLALIILSPLFLFLAILVKTSSKGPVFFSQERIGLNGKPFRIIKFRTMFPDSERNGPQLSSANDTRITQSGKFMRKTRFDEFPQFYNVLKGDMSLVGPRPERQFYIDQITKLEPQFVQLTKVRPGITSWGQVKYGYAENVDQMIQRMKYDLLYLKNRSIALDIKIMLYTIIIIFRAKGK